MMSHAVNCVAEQHHSYHLSYSLWVHPSIAVAFIEIGTRRVNRFNFPADYRSAREARDSVGRVKFRVQCATCHAFHQQGRSAAAPLSFKYPLTSLPPNLTSHTYEPLCMRNLTVEFMPMTSLRWFTALGRMVCLTSGTCFDFCVSWCRWQFWRNYSSKYLNAHIC